MLNPLLCISLFASFFIAYLVDYFSSGSPSGSGSQATASVPLTRMTVKGGTSQACAACKYQRRKCTPDCPLAPFFPPDQPKMFQNAHRLYGVSNILKIINQLPQPQKIEAMRSIIYQSDIREKFPVHGCLGIIYQLQRQIQQAELELEAINTQIKVCRQHHQNQMSSSPSVAAYSPSSHLQQLQLSGDTKNVLPLYNPQPFNGMPAMPVGKPMSPPYQSLSSGDDVVCDANYVDSKDNSLWLHNQYNNNVMTNQPQSFVPLQYHLQQPAEVLLGYDEISPAFYDIDDRQSYIESKETYESSCESSMRDTKNSIEHIADNELKDPQHDLGLQMSIN